MTALEVFVGSNGAMTRAFYAELEKLGPAGIVALNLFRAQKCSDRAKVYRGRGYKDAAYDRKSWSMGNLCAALAEHSEALGIRWGWGTDARLPYTPHVLYIDLPPGQVSFHSPERMAGPDYPGKWDEMPGWSRGRIICFCEVVREGRYSVPRDAGVVEGRDGSNGGGPNHEHCAGER